MSDSDLSLIPLFVTSSPLLKQLQPAPREVVTTLDLHLKIEVEKLDTKHDFERSRYSLSTDESIEKTIELEPLDEKKISIQSIKPFTQE